MTPQNPYKVCPRCRMQSPIDARTCGSCGHIFSTQFQAQPNQVSPNQNQPVQAPTAYSAPGPVPNMAYPPQPVRSAKPWALIAAASSLMCVALIFGLWVLGKGRASSASGSFGEPELVVTWVKQDAHSEYGYIENLSNTPFEGSVRAAFARPTTKSGYATGFEDAYERVSLSALSMVPYGQSKSKRAVHAADEYLPKHQQSEPSDSELVRQDDLVSTEDVHIGKGDVYWVEKPVIDHLVLLTRKNGKLDSAVFVESTNPDYEPKIPRGKTAP